MSKDYAHRSNNQDDSRQPKNKHRFLFNIKIIFILIFIAIIIFLFVNHHAKIKKENVLQEKIKVSNLEINQRTINFKNQNANETTQVKTPEKKDTSDPLNAKVNYTFYKTLPNMTSTSIVDDDDKKNSSSQHQEYILQLASFSDNAHADNLVQKLKKLNFDTTVTIFTRGDNKIYRVQMGPYTNIIAAREKQDDLQIADIPSLLLVIK